MRYIEGDTSYYILGSDIYPIGFKIFYGDNSTYSGKGTSIQLKELWDLAINQDIQVIILYENILDGLGRHTRMIYSGIDYYIFDGTRFIFSNTIHEGTVLYGKWDDYTDFMNIFYKAMDDYEI